MNTTYRGRVTCGSLLLAFSALTAFGGESYFPGVCTPMPANFFGSVAFDIDGDGRDELVSAVRHDNFGPYFIEALHVDASGSVSPAPLASSQLASALFGDYRIERADFTNDGAADVLLATYAGIEIVPGTGTGFGPAYALAVVCYLTPESGDLDLDGDLDLLVPDAAGTNLIALLNDGTGHVASSVSTPGMPGAFIELARLGDFDQDGRQDAVTAVTQTHVATTALVQRGLAAPGSFVNGATSTFKQSYGPTKPHGLVAADFDQDGDADAAGTFGGFLQLLRSNGATAFLPAISFATGGNQDLSTADLDGDAWPDLVSTTWWHALFTLRNPAVAPVLTKSPLPGEVSWPAVGSFTGTQRHDVACCAPIVTLSPTGLTGTVTVFPGEGAAPPEFGVPIVKDLLAPLGSAEIIRNVDFDGDGHPDLVVATTAGFGNIVVLRGDGSLGFTAGTASSTENFLPDMEVGDLDLDGDLDVAAAAKTAFANIYRQTTPGNLASAVNPLAHGEYVTMIEIGDLDLDGRLDLVGGVSSPPQSSLRIAHNTNPVTLTFVEQAAYPIAGELKTVDLADIDLDLDPDAVISRMDGTSMKAVLEIAPNSAGSLGSLTNSVVLGKTLVRNPVVDDLDGDGRPDVYARVHESMPLAYVVFARGNGAGFGALESLPVAWSGASVEGGDLDCDGRVDLLVENADYGTQEVYERAANGSFVLQSIEPGIAELARLDDDLAPERFVRTPVVTELIVAKNGSPGTVESFGSGCLLGGSTIPLLAATEPAAAGGPFTLSLSNGFGGGTAVVFFGFQTTVLPINPYGCALYVTPLLPVQLTIPLSGVGPGQGSFALATTLPPALAGICFSTQAFVIQGPAAYAATNGLSVRVE